MTTIAYKHSDREVAYDSRLTRNGVVATDDAEKAITNKHGTFLFCGDSAHAIDAAGAYPDSAGSNVNCYGFLVKEGGAFWLSYNDGVPSTLPLSYDEAAGSGEDFALASMDLGYSAADAISIAGKRDIYTGGKVRVIKITDKVK